MDDKKLHSYLFLTLFANENSMGNSALHLQTTVNDKTFRDNSFSKQLEHLNKIKTIELTRDFIMYQESRQNENDGIDLKYNDNNGDRFEMSHELVAGSGGVNTNISNTSNQSAYSDSDGAANSGQKNANTTLILKPNSSSSSLDAKFKRYLSGDGTQNEFADFMDSREEQQGNNDYNSLPGSYTPNYYNNLSNISSQLVHSGVTISHDAEHDSSPSPERMRSTGTATRDSNIMLRSNINDDMMPTINETMSQDDKNNQYNNDNSKNSNNNNNAISKMATHNNGRNGNKCKNKNKNNVNGMLVFSILLWQ